MLSSARLLGPALRRIPTAAPLRPSLGSSAPCLAAPQSQGGSVRTRWTKAKKKRVARYEHRQGLAKRGKEVAKPPHYQDQRNTPVINALTKEEREAQRLEKDAAAAEHIRTRRSMASDPVLMRHHFDNVVMSDRVQKLFDLANGNRQEIARVQKERSLQLFQKRPGDTGSSAVQVIALTNRIQQLQAHLSTHRKDKHSRRGMDALFTRRRKMLDYMERKDFEEYRRVVKTLGLNR